MSDYKTLKGQNLKILDADPSPVYKGQVWYAGNSLKVQSVAASVWTVGGTLNTARTELGGAGTQTAGLAFV